MNATHLLIVPVMVAVLAVCAGMVYLANSAAPAACKTVWGFDITGISHFHGDTLRCYHGNVLAVQK